MTLRKLLSLLRKPEIGNRTTGTAADPVAEAEAKKNLGNDHLSAGNLDKAAECYRQAIRLYPEYAEAYANLGFVLRENRRYVESESLLVQALALNPGLWQAHFNLGGVFEEQGQIDRAIGSYEKAVQVADAAKAAPPQACWRLAALYASEGRHEDALRLMREIVAHNPDEAEAHCNIAVTLSKLGRAAEGIHYLETLLASKPHHLIAHFLGLAYQQDRQWDKAKKHFELACRLMPDFHEPGFDLALLLLLLGDYEHGWPQFEKYLPLVRDKSIAADVALTEAQYYREKFTPQKYWQGDALAGRRLLVWTEQGLGDTLMMLRYLPVLQARGAKEILVHCEQALARIVENMPGAYRVVVKPGNEDGIEFDCHCSMLSLPFLCGTRLDSIPRDVPYIAVPAVNKAYWYERLAPLKGMKVGLVWGGNRKLAKDRLRSIPLAQFAPLFDIPGVNWISLQKGEAAAELDGATWPILNWMDECQDLLDTAGLVEHLDLIITVDTAMVHLAGALGRPAWLLNRYESEWRWLLDREDSPWYPTVRIFRQQTAAEWHSAIHNLAGALADLAAARPTSQLRGAAEAPW